MNNFWHDMIEGELQNLLCYTQLVWCAAGLASLLVIYSIIQVNSSLHTLSVLSVPRPLCVSRNLNVTVLYVIYTPMSY